jgi:peptidyl-prolyl cis-trans isomerase A (cyclophilin A)
MKRVAAIALSLGLAVPAWAANPTVEMKTSMGPVTIELFADKAPVSVENFVQYAKAGFYNGTIFHRVIDGFMIQGGGFTATTKADGSVHDIKQKETRAPIQNESRNGLKNEAGTLAMARTSAPHSATAQFYINLVNNRNLDYPSFDGWGYAVFGKVTQGFEVMQKIAKVPTGIVGGHQNVPQQPVIIESVRVVDAAAATTTPAPAAAPAAAPVPAK